MLFGPGWVDWGEIAPEQSQPLGLACGSVGPTRTWALWLRNHRSDCEFSVKRHTLKPGLRKLPQIQPQEQELPGESHLAHKDTDPREAVPAETRVGSRQADCGDWGGQAEDTTSI